LTKKTNCEDTEGAERECFNTFKVRLDGALSNLIQLKMSLLTAGGGTLDDL